ncbi:MAG: hypothetical protein DRH90_09345 [Deltaproteobacteria bacterium]|nr:MAG: hypothetical protein DRH90_09345 [Deltaproteobacteria bacterium]RLC11632.1 MAG: hypothetical protein DRI24_18515 [Deltaproteobacteria bacterium]
MKTKCLSIFFFCSIALVLSNNPVFSQDSEWVTVNGIAPIENVTKNEARKMAIANARREAVEKVVGVDILSETMVINYHVSGDVIRTIPHGKVIGQEIIKEEIELIPAKDKGEAPYLAYKVTMRANVIKEKGQIDVFFRLEAELNRTVFKEGDLIEIRVTPSRDCYLSIFNILEDETAIILFPNRFKQNNFVKANTSFAFPDDMDRKRGITLEAFLGEGKEKVDEIIHILALKEPLHFNTAKFKEGIFGIYDGRSAMVNDLVKNIVGIPLSHRAEKFIQYRITK